MTGDVGSLWCVGFGVIYVVVFFLLCLVFKLTDPNRYLDGRSEMAAFFWPIVIPVAIVILIGYAVWVWCEVLLKVKIIEKVRDNG